MVICQVREDDEHFVIDSQEAILDNEHSLVGRHLNVEAGYDDCDEENVRMTAPNDCKVTGQTAPSVNNYEKHVMRKPDQVLGVEYNAGTDEPKIECKYKRGGMCMIHDVKGTKIVDSTKVWTKKKNGLFGYEVKKKVRYVCQNIGVAKPAGLECQDSRVAKSNDVFQDTGGGKQTISYEALGGQTNKAGNLLGVCGADYRQADSNERESLEISSADKDLD